LLSQFAELLRILSRGLGGDTLRLRGVPVLFGGLTADFGFFANILCLLAALSGCGESFAHVIRLPRLGARHVCSMRHAIR
jgi:hypothetical protein